MTGIKYIDEVKISGKKILLRVDFNVTLKKNGEIKDPTRIEQAIPTIAYLLSQHNKLILVSHLGRPEARDKKFSLRVVSDYLQSRLTDKKVILVDDFESEEGKNIISNQKENEIIFLENIRFFKGEQEESLDFAARLASIADFYVNDAFGVCHRKDASIVGVPNFLPSYGGLLLKKEVKIISNVMENAKEPFVVILGGAKVSTKLGLIRKLTTVADYLLLGGGMANTFLYAEGINVGNSLFEKGEAENARDLMSFAKENNSEIVLPCDVVVGNPQDESSDGVVKNLGDIPSDMAILDIGPKTQEKYSEIISKAGTVIWNGPVGYIENEKYQAGNNSIYYAIRNNANVLSIAGGGDTLASISGKNSLKEFFTHVSTGGGSMIEFIEKGTLPGLEALQKRPHQADFLLS